MRFLKVKINDGMFDYIPLEHAEFLFSKCTNGKYKVNIFSSGRNIRGTDDNGIGISSLDDFMLEIADVPDRDMIDLDYVFNKWGVNK